MEDGRIWRKILACDRYVAAVGRRRARRSLGGRAAPLSLLLPAFPSIRRPSVRPSACDRGRINCLAGFARPPRLHATRWRLDR